MKVRASKGREESFRMLEATVPHGRERQSQEDEPGAKCVGPEATQL